jgi:hypothetical protein
VTADSQDSFAGEPDETKRATSNDESEATDLPAHRDPDKLQAVYETNETFEAMKEALDTDVTAQTVRRNMIKHGFHDPEARQSASDEETTESSENSGAPDTEAHENAPPSSSSTPSSGRTGRLETRTPATLRPSNRPSRRTRRKPGTNNSPSIARASRLAPSSLRTDTG